MSDFYNKYPYTDFHELNLDWIIARVKQLTADWLETKEAWENTEAEWQELYTYVHDYFDNLNVQTEINNKINAMIADGSLLTIIQPVIEAQTRAALPGEVSSQIGPVVASQIGNTVAQQIDGAVIEQLTPIASPIITDWLNDNVTPTGSAVMVDNTLAIAGDAADSKTTGDVIKELRDLGFTGMIPLGPTAGRIPTKYFDGLTLQNLSTASCTHITETEGLLTIDFVTLTGNAGLVFVRNSGSSVFTKYGHQLGTFSVDVSDAEEIYINFFGSSYCAGFSIKTLQMVNASEVMGSINGINGRFSPSRNLYNPATELTDYRIDGSGVPAVRAGYKTSDYIDVSGITALYCNAKTCFFASYDISKTFIAGSYGFYTVTEGTRQVVPIAAGAAYVRISPYYQFDINTIDDVNYFYICDTTASHTAMTYAQYFMPDLVVGTGQTQYEGAPGYNFFDVMVDNSDVLTGTSANASQSNTNHVNVHAVIRLPNNYSTNGEPIQAIMICHGAGYGVTSNYWGADSGSNAPFEALQQAFIDQGFAIMDINGSENTFPFFSWGCKRTVDAYRRLYEYCAKHYNIKKLIGVYGFSMGGIVSLNFTYFNRDIVSKLALGCPTVSLYGTYKYKNAFRQGIAPAYKFQGTAPTWTDQYTQAEDDYYQANIALTYGQDPYVRALEIDNNKYMFDLPPIRVWYGLTDDGIDPQGVYNLITAVTNAGGLISIREVAGQGHRVCYGGVPVVNEEIATWMHRTI